MRAFRLSAACALCAAALLAGGCAAAPPAKDDYDMCVEDDTNKTDALRFNSKTGQSLVCTGGGWYSTLATVSRGEHTIILQISAGDRDLMANVDTAAKTGSAVFQAPRGKTLARIHDSNTGDSRCLCR